METSGLLCTSDGISCRLGSVCVISFFRGNLPSEPYWPEKCLWEGKGPPSSTPNKMHTKASCKNVAFLFHGFSPVQWGAEPSSAWPVLFCLAHVLCYDSMIWFFSLLFLAARVLQSVSSVCAKEYLMCNSILKEDLNKNPSCRILTL